MHNWYKLAFLARSDWTVRVLCKRPVIISLKYLWCKNFATFFKNIKKKNYVPLTSNFLFIVYCLSPFHHFTFSRSNKAREHTIGLIGILIVSWVTNLFDNKANLVKVHYGIFIILNKRKSRKQIGPTSPWSTGDLLVRRLITIKSNKLHNSLFLFFSKIVDSTFHALRST